MGGVIALHASVDLLNDYSDYKRGIDTKTQRTKMSGGTGVLTEGLLQPKQVYRAGIAFLILGALIGSYFVIVDGIIIGILLTFAVLSIYFYFRSVVSVLISLRSPDISRMTYGGLPIVRKCKRAIYSPMTPMAKSCSPANRAISAARKVKPGT